MTANKTSFLVFIDDVNANKSKTMKIQPNCAKLIGEHFSVQMDNDLKNTLKAAKDKGKDVECAVMIISIT